MGVSCAKIQVIYLCKYENIVTVYLSPSRFFEDYKKNEHKEVRVEEYQGAEEAKKIVKDSLVSGKA